MVQYSSITFIISTFILPYFPLSQAALDSVTQTSASLQRIRTNPINPDNLLNISRPDSMNALPFYLDDDFLWERLMQGSFPLGECNINLDPVVKCTLVESPNTSCNDFANTFYQTPSKLCSADVLYGFRLTNEGQKTEQITAVKTSIDKSQFTYITDAERNIIPGSSMAIRQQNNLDFCNYLKKTITFDVGFHCNGELVSTSASLAFKLQKAQCACKIAVVMSPFKSPNNPLVPMFNLTIKNEGLNSVSLQTLNLIIDENIQVVHLANERLDSDSSIYFLRPFDLLLETDCLNATAQLEYKTLTGESSILCKTRTIIYDIGLNFKSTKRLSPKQDHSNGKGKKVQKSKKMVHSEEDGVLIPICGNKLAKSKNIRSTKSKQINNKNRNSKYTKGMTGKISKHPNQLVISLKSKGGISSVNNGKGADKNRSSKYPKLMKTKFRSTKHPKEIVTNFKTKEGGKGRGKGTRTNINQIKNSKSPDVTLQKGGINGKLNVSTKADIVGRSRGKGGNINKFIALKLSGKLQGSRHVN